MKEKVSFEVSLPVEVCLANTAGHAVEGRLGNEVMYQLIDKKPTVREVYVRAGESFDRISKTLPAER